jgi:hypothetical protein
MFKVIPWSAELDLEWFYREASQRGFSNNCSQKTLVDCFNREREKQVWILYYNNNPIGSVAAHSFDDVMGPNSYRIAARTCVFTDCIEGTYGNGLRTISVITKLQNPTAQFLIPACIEWAPKGSRLFITTNQSPEGTQRRVHTIFGPAMEKKGIMKQIKTVEYRGLEQTVWELFPDRFYEELNRYNRWN